MRTFLALAVAALMLAVPTSVSGWGMDVHRMLTRRAIEGLPPELKPFFMEQLDFIVEHAADPDLWRVIGLRGDLGEEDPNHFVDLDDLGEPPPFTNVPRTWGGLIARYGIDGANKGGRLPWRAQEIFDRLVSLFQAMARPSAPAYGGDNARYVAAVLSHYIEDAHQPFHATGNYDGQLTRQNGIHSRFETTLPLRHLSALTLAPVAIKPIGNVTDFMFETLVASQALVAPVLDADRKATEGREFYDDAYYTAFLAGTRTILERRMSESSSAVASVIVAAWEKGGKPGMPLPRPANAPPAPIRRTP